MADGLQHGSSANPSASAETHAGVPLTIIRPDSRVGESWIASIRHLANELCVYRSHIATVFRHTLRQTYYGSAMATFWQVVMPLLPIAVYAALAGLRVVPTVDGMNATIYVAVGATLWFLFVGCVQQPIIVVRSRNREAMKTALPLSVTIAASFAQLVFDVVVRLALLVAMMAYTKTVPALTSPIALGVLAIAIVSFLGLGLVLAILNIVYPDIERVTGVFLSYGIFLSGVIFPLAAFGPFWVLDYINPFAVFIDATRHLLFVGMAPHPAVLTMFAGLGIVMFALGCRLFYVMEYRIRGIG